MEEDIKDIVRLLVGTCMHDDCGMSLMLPKTFYKYGAILLHGPKDAYVGFVCPECERTTLIKHDLVSFNEIKSLFVSSQDSFVSTSKSLKYWSFPYTLEQHEDHESLYTLNLTYLLHDKMPVVSEIDVRVALRKSGDDEPAPLPEGYCSYGFGDPAIGPVIALWWYAETEIEKLVDLENETRLKVFPRYFPNNPLIERSDDFVFSFYLSPDYEEQQREAIGAVDGNPRSRIKRSIYRNLHYLNILDTLVQQQPVDDGQSRILIDTPEDLGGVTAMTMPVHEMPDAQDEDGIRERLRILDHLWDHFADRDIQHLISRNAAKFASQYPSLCRRTDFSFELLWRLKEEQLKRISHYIWKESLSSQRYALYKEGASWSLVFDGKKIRGLRGNGFKYIQYLVQHRGQQFSTDDLSLLDGTASNKTDHGYSYQEGLRTGEAINMSITLEVGDRETISEIKKELGTLYREKDIAEDNNDIGRREQIESEIDRYETYLKEYAEFMEHSKRFNNESKRTQLRIAKSVERAIKQLEKHNRKAYKHFIKAIHPINSFTLGYNPVEPIDWHIG
jgi:hypothetical protein